MLICCVWGYPDPLVELVKGSALQSLCHLGCVGALLVVVYWLQQVGALQQPSFVRGRIFVGSDFVGRFTYLGQYSHMLHISFVSL